MYLQIYLVFSLGGQAQQHQHQENTAKTHGIPHGKGAAQHKRADDGGGDRLGKAVQARSPAALLSGIASACCVVIYTMWPKKLQQQYPTPMLQGWAFLMGGTMFALIFRPWTMNYVPTAMGVFGIFTVVVLGNVLAFSLYMSGVPLIGPQKASLYSFAEPVTAAIISTLVLGSPFTLWDALGFGCIFLMLVLLSLPAKTKA